MNEIWKDIAGYEGLYQVSSLGRVKSLWHGKEKILKPLDNGKGYYMVRLYLNTKGKNFKVHQLVAMAFLNHKPCKMKLVVDHVNDIKTDNRVDNLQLISQRENTRKTQGKYLSKYKGVTWHKQRNKWVAQIHINGKSKHLGLFTSEEEASQSYQNALKEIVNK